MRRQKKNEYLKFTLAQGNDNFLYWSTEHFLALVDSLQIQRVIHNENFTFIQQNLIDREQIKYANRCTSRNKER